eukprot:14304562-Alexandrium_andersonii.AAC.1
MALIILAQTAGKRADYRALQCATARCGVARRATAHATAYDATLRRAEMRDGGRRRSIYDVLLHTPAYHGALRSGYMALGLRMPARFRTGPGHGHEQACPSFRKADARIDDRLGDDAETKQTNPTPAAPPW